MILKKDNKRFTKKLLTASERVYYSNFECGNEYIDNYIRHKAVDDPDSTSFIYIDNETRRTVCACSLSCSGIVAEPDNKVHVYPAVEIRNFALSLEYQHKRFDKNNTYGDIFLADVIESINDFTEKYCGASRIVLYAVPEYVSFYERNFFRKFESFMKRDESFHYEDCVPMFYLF